VAAAAGSLYHRVEGAHQAHPGRFDEREGLLLPFDDRAEDPTADADDCAGDEDKVSEITANPPSKATVPLDM
jgi:hypothetical protein